ncbi:MAG: flagellar biosynthesis chaperone FliJ [Bacillaceae bacterium]|nr:flagellar biosynthesis chaperone FliJ [Bacillaceae bacterium]
MPFRFTLQKILDVKENEKIRAEKDFSEATRQFEEVATKLYTLLKKKEDYESTYYEKVGQGMIVSEIQQSHSLLEKLQRQIDQYQLFTQRARENMNRKQEVFLEKAVECKKYEKMKELRYEEYVEDGKRQEKILMDEISVQQFFQTVKLGD